MRELKSSILLYFHYVKIHIQSIMQYKVSFLLTAIGQFFISFNVFLGLFFMFQRFSNVEGFGYSEVLLCFGIFLLEFSLAEAISRGLDLFPSMVRKGEFDRVLVRPRNEILQVLGSKFELTRIVRMLQAVVMFFYGVHGCEVQWSFLKVLTIIFMLIGGFLLFTGIFLIYAALSFFTLEGLEFMNAFTDGAREFGKYPFNIYGKRLMQFTTFVIPYTLVQYYPLLYIIGRSDNIGYAFLPLLTSLFLIPCYCLWRFGVRHYQSSGS